MGGRHTDTSGDGADDVGTLAEEAAKFIGALSGWAQEHGSGAGPVASGLADHLADRVSQAAHQTGEHVATDAPECAVCPVCRAIRVYRQLSPEVRDHLSVAASSLVQAAAGLMATVVPEADDGPAGAGGEPRSGRRTDRVEETVLDEDRREENS